ncbi:retrograde regulation protein 2 [Mytilinidion resinicola]|uniref:Retrograde regulation protein 2 n=1 Tax=Mytilinidion resinicola TaxID=574789 RepID=A0A6A6Z3E5_9PEZI|nr:retrograde regulation protein 2 [Mytilinidion resinicola]KAF2815183.1 retrograde regulation protein 2 [Mytilinidion resinicola]
MTTFHRLLPPIAILYLCNFFDRSNVGNAKILGLEDDLHLTNHHYAVALSIFYVFYVVSDLPSNLFLKTATPRLWLPILAILWGIVVMCIGFVRNFAEFVVVRSLLGIFEGGLYPGSLLYLSMMYTKEELALRVGIFYSSASLSGAFGGLLASGLSHVPKTSIVDGKWRWIMIIEYILTILCGISAIFLIPNSVETASFLTPTERSHAIIRGILSPQLWLNATAYFAICCALYSFSLFLPSIIVSLGRSGSKAQLMTVPPYAVAAVTGTLVAFLSDRLRLRGVLVLFTLPLGVIGYAVIARVESASVKYGMTFLMAVGIYSSVPPILVWLLNNSAGHYKRATSGAMQLVIANCGGIVAAFLYPNDQKPVYYESHNVVMGCLCYAWLAVLNVLYCLKVNKDKAEGKYDKYIGYGDDRDPSFKMIL